MSRCMRCNELIRNEDCAECVDCENKYHFECSISENLYRKTNRKQKIWKCENCTSTIATRAKSSEFSKFEKTLFDLTQKVNDLLTLKTEISELTHAVNFMSDNYDKLFKELENNKKEIISVKQEVENLKKDNEEKNNIIYEMKEQVEQLEQYSRNQNVEITGIKQVPDEDCKQIVLKIAQELNVDININDIDVAHRTYSYNKKYPPSIVARMVTRTKRDELITKKPLVILNNNIPGTAIGSKVYVSEHLTSANKNLMRLAKIRAREVNYKFVWFKYNKLLVRKEYNTPVIRIFNEEDILKKIS